MPTSKTAGAASTHDRLARYAAKRDFARTAEPAPNPPKAGARAPIFVVQKHAARRLHWDFRLEHDGVLWSWAVPKGPSLDPADKRLAVHVEDHPLDYADFQGRIPEGEYGAGTVETWDRGTWRPLGDAEQGLRDGELKFVLDGQRLRGGFVLVRLKPRPKERADNWLLIKEHDDAERPGGDAGTLEAKPVRTSKRAPKKQPEAAPAPGATRGTLPRSQAPQLATQVDAAPDQPGWITEVKFDGYRLLAFLDAGHARLVTRNGHDWTARLPTVAAAVTGLGASTVLLDGELVALRDDGVSSFADLQAALAEGRDERLFYYLFDLPHLDGWDLRACRLDDRKAALAKLSDWRGALRYSDHIADDSERVRQRACAMGLEGVICKQASAPYRAGRGGAWLKLKCQGRDEFVVLGWTPPAGSRAGLGALHLGFRDAEQRMHYAGGVGTGFSDAVLAALRRRLDGLRSGPPVGLLYAGEPPERRINWVTPTLVAEVRYAGWSGAGRVRHAVYVGLREDKDAADVVRDLPDPDAERHSFTPPSGATRIVRAAAIAHPKPAVRTGAAATTKVVAMTKSSARDSLEGVTLTHPDRALWPGITKRDLADYWQTVAPRALPGIAHRPLALVRCPDGVDGQHFFQKHPSPGFPPQIRAGQSGGAPWLAIDDAAGLIALAQMSAIELHAWGATEADPLHPDHLVLDLDPGEGVAMPAIVAAAQEVRDRLAQRGLIGFCRTSGGKGLHVVVPLVPAADWDTTRDWCHGFAQAMEQDEPDRYVSTVPKQRRRGHILVDWLRNGLGATAVASFSPRARPGAGVATPLAWRELTDDLDPAAFTLATVPDRLRRQRQDPWRGFAEAARPLPNGGG
jgi:bifunctional non-homologous end joining protein LigD